MGMGIGGARGGECIRIPRTDGREQPDKASIAWPPAHGVPVVWFGAWWFVASYFLEGSCYGHCQSMQQLL